MQRAGIVGGSIRANPGLMDLAHSSPMSDRKYRWIPALALGAFLAAGVGSASAAVITATAYTSSNYTYTSLTLGGVAHSTLTGSTATIVTDADRLNYWITGSTPTLSGSGITNTVASGLSFREGTGNILAGSRFQFGRVITASDYIFISDLGTGDDVSLELVSAANVALGTLSLTASQFGSGLLPSAGYQAIYTTGVSYGNIAASVQSVVAFQLADFNITGDVSLATGIRLSTASGVDPSVVGLAAVPEPSAALLGLGTIPLLPRRRRVKA
jgi:hypothetical protein